MGANEEPDDLIVVLPDANGTVRTGDANRPKRQRGVKALKLQAGMSWIGLEAAIGRSRPLLDVAGELGEIAAE